MSFITDLAAKRQKFLDGLDANEGDINLRIFEDFYPDEAHFLYELLQNAEDTGATEVFFELNQNSCAFIHNGPRYFDHGDISAITGIFNSSKKDSPDKIGKFGVGFKSVYVYTETPHIWSPSVAFKISEYFLPTEIPARKELKKNTRFEFPFNNKKKLPSVAYEEIKLGLNLLPESALLFLANIKSISWRIGEQEAQQISRIEHFDCHIELIRKVGGNVTSNHFLQFMKPVENLPNQNISIAFNLDFLPKITAFNSGEAISRQFRITPAVPGRVFVFFPAEKEASGLRFHLHAPFVPELSRASIKETPANIPLYSQLAALTAASLHQIRDLGLLTGEFLAVLPNPQDEIPPRYQLIRSSIVDAMNKHPLTPTHAKSHAPASRLIQTKASLKDLLSNQEDIRLLNTTSSYFEYGYHHSLNFDGWAIGASQKNSNQDRFLSGLAIREWNIDDFVEFLDVMMRKWDSDEIDESLENINEFQEWMFNKSIEWHQAFYALLSREVISAGEKLPYFYVRCSDGEYYHNSLYFSSEGDESGSDFHFIEKGVYSSGNNVGQQVDSKEFLEEIGVHKVSELDKIEITLRNKYQRNTSNRIIDLDEIERFAKFIDENPQHINIFTYVQIFLCQDGKWRHGSQTFIDAPFSKTGLSIYHGIFKSPKRWALSDSYLQDIAFNKPGFHDLFVKFACLLGAQIGLKIIPASCWDNPQKNELSYGAPGGWSHSYGVDRDYTIEGLKEALALKNEAISMLIWKTVCEAPPAWMTAVFRNNSQQSYRRAPSQLFAKLRDFPWVPQKGDAFALPSKAVRNLLPDGFAFDEGYAWIKEIKFGSKSFNNPVEVSPKISNILKARELGFENEKVLDDALYFAKIDPNERQRFIDDHKRKQIFELPDNSPRNPQLRTERVVQQAKEAPERISELRTRSISVGRDDVKKEAAQYLQQQYTNDDGEMICQVCQDALPFKLADGSYYFEKVEFLPDITNRHYQNYLALCPNHAAMFKHANGSEDTLLQLVKDSHGGALAIELASTDTQIYFTNTHLVDLQAVINADDGVDCCSRTEEDKGDAPEQPKSDKPEENASTQDNKVHFPESNESQTEMVKCPECQSFVRKDRLQKHILRVHINKQTAAPIASINNNKAAFLRPLVVTGNRPYEQCPFCFVLLKSTELSKHIINSHPENYQRFLAVNQRKQS